MKLTFYILLLAVCLGQCKSLTNEELTDVVLNLKEIVTDLVVSNYLYLVYLTKIDSLRIYSKTATPYFN